MLNSRITRRDVIRTGAAGLASLGITSQLIKLSVAAEGSPLPIKVVATNSNLTFTMIGIAKEKRFLDDLGLKPTYDSIADGSKAIPAIISGDVDFCTLTGVNLLFPAVEKGGKLKLLGGSSLLLQNAILSAKPDIKSVKDLEGRSVGTGALGALTHQLMVALCAKRGVDASKIQFRNVGGTVDIFKAVAAGTVDAGPCALDVYFQQAKYGVHGLSDGDFWKELPEFTFQASFASDNAIAQKRDALVRVLASFAKLYRFVQGPDSKDSFVKNHMAVSGAKDDSDAVSAWKFIQDVKPYSSDITLSEERIRYMQDLNVRLAVQNAMLPYDEVADMSLARDALKLVG